MFKTILKTLVGGAIGIAALYVVAKVAFEVGQEFANITNQQNTTSQPTCRPANVVVSEDNTAESSTVENQTLTCSTETTETKTTVRPLNKLSTIFTLFKIFGKKNNRSVLGDLVNDPEAHTMEAYVNEGEVHINIKKRRTVQPARNSQHIMEGNGTFT